MPSEPPSPPPSRAPAAAPAPDKAAAPPTAPTLAPDRPPTPEHPPTPGRLVAELDQGLPGPTFVAQGGIHGNEPAGVLAIERVLGEIAERGLTVRGRVVGCRGNLGALALGRRFLDRDLNRAWTAEERLRLARAAGAETAAEHREQRELLALYERLWDSRSGPLVLIDLHTSSADGPPFTCLADTLPNRRIADALPIPMILGLEECIDGAVLEWFAERGQTALAIEGGKHADPGTVLRLESALWLTLLAAGVLSRSEVDPVPHRERLLASARGIPHLLEIRRRHAIRPEDGFVMRPGFSSFQAVAKGQPLADDRQGPVLASESALVLLPLYQAQGEDGFFLARRVRRVWFTLSAWLRPLGRPGLLALLPGVGRDPHNPAGLLVNPRVARWWAIEVFHLFGYRRQRPRGTALAFSRRETSD